MRTVAVNASWPGVLSRQSCFLFCSYIVRTSVLRDTGFWRGQLLFTDVIQRKRCFTVVNVTHDCNDRSAWFQIFFCILLLYNFVFFPQKWTRFVPELIGNHSDRLCIRALVDRNEPKLKQVEITSFTETFINDARSLAEMNSVSFQVTLIRPVLQAFFHHPHPNSPDVSLFCIWTSALLKQPPLSSRCCANLFLNFPFGWFKRSTWRQWFLTTTLSLGLLFCRGLVPANACAGRSVHLLCLSDLNFLQVIPSCAPVGRSILSGCARPFSLSAFALINSCSGFFFFNQLVLLQRAAFSQQPVFLRVQSFFFFFLAGSFLSRSIFPRTLIPSRTGRSLQPSGFVPAFSFLSFGCSLATRFLIRRPVLLPPGVLLLSRFPPQDFQHAWYRLSNRKLPVFRLPMRRILSKKRELFRA